MSGTGNTYRLGCWMKDIADRYLDKTKIVMIDDADFDNELKQSNDFLVGLLFPTHGFMPPWSMIKFLFRIPKKKGVPALCVATRGGIKIGPLFIPGIAGFGTFMAAILMMLKGYHVRAVFSLDMPSNFINFHWGLHPKNVDAISKRSRIKLERLMPRIMGGHNILFTLNNLWEAFWSVLLFWLIPLFPIIYLLIGRLFMAKLMFSNNRCIGCGQCARFCPNNAILMKDIGKKKRPYWTYHCETCLRCMGYCKRKAVEAGHSWAVLLYFIVSIPVFATLLSWLHGIFNFVPTIRGYWINEILNIFYLLPALLFSYWVFWYLIRLPAVNTIFTFTTFTHYYRRYHQPETELKHIVRKKKMGANRYGISVTTKADISTLEE